MTITVTFLFKFENIVLTVEKKMNIIDADMIKENSIITLHNNKQWIFGTISSTVIWKNTGIVYVNLTNCETGYIDDDIFEEDLDI